MQAPIVAEWGITGESFVIDGVEYRKGDVIRFKGERSVGPFHQKAKHDVICKITTIFVDDKPNLIWTNRWCHDSSSFDSCFFTQINFKLNCPIIDDEFVYPTSISKIESGDFFDQCAAVYQNNARETATVLAQALSKAEKDAQELRKAAREAEDRALKAEKDAQELRKYVRAEPIKRPRKRQENTELTEPSEKRQRKKPQIYTEITKPLIFGKFVE